MATSRILKRALAAAGAVVAAGIVALAGYFLVLKPERAEPSRVKVAATKARIERGEYLFRLADCDGCHSGRDFSRFNGPVIEGRRGAGMMFPASFGLPGTVVAPNITNDPETGIGKWTDGEKIRAIRDGVSRDGRPLFPMMPYQFYRHMSDDDVESLVAFLNTLPPVKNALPPTRIAFPVENMPRLLQLVSLAIPMRYYLVIVRSLILKGVGISTLWLESGMLLVMGVSILVASVLRFHKKID